MRKQSPIERHLDSLVRADDFDFSHLADEIGRHARALNGQRKRLELEFIIIDNPTRFDEKRSTQIGNVLLRKVFKL